MIELQTWIVPSPQIKIRCTRQQSLDRWNRFRAGSSIHTGSRTGLAGKAGLPGDQFSEVSANKMADSKSSVNGKGAGRDTEELEVNGNHSGCLRRRALRNVSSTPTDLPKSNRVDRPVSGSARLQYARILEAPDQRTEFELNGRILQIGGAVFRIRMYGIGNAAAAKRWLTGDVIDGQIYPGAGSKRKSSIRTPEATLLPSVDK